MNELATKSRQDTMIYKRSDVKGSREPKSSMCFVADWEYDPDVCRNCYIRTHTNLRNMDELAMKLGRGTKTLLQMSEIFSKFLYESDESVIRWSKAWTDNKSVKEESSTSRRQ
ncbi:hypothetical protein M9H77_04259 [Catharanthus roseus]|uniref:Uncharacterized protein n=1 Tax=Catharanthus roseus TaxID=4058 RepID=A0ACC0CDL1_CATRO|nr:hypothetical protein M9H77_04259 [Catharanthus roseus]